MLKSIIWTLFNAKCVVEKKTQKRGWGEREMWKRGRQRWREEDSEREGKEKKRRRRQ